MSHFVFAPVHRENGVEFLSFRLWIGVWVSLFLLTAVALDLSALIRYITRFTEESFAVLISVIFVYQSVRNVPAIAPFVILMSSRY